MLFEPRLREGIAAGTITVAFRRWRRCQVRPGGRYRTGTGIIEMDSVSAVEPAAITTADATLAGYGSAADVLADLRDHDGTTLYRLEFHRVDEPDPRTVLAQSASLSAAEAEELRRRLERMDKASTKGSWTQQTLRMIAERPGTRAGDLAADLGWERLPFKANVRKLKALGLTISLEIGYRLSPRGAAYLATTRPISEPPTGHPPS